MASARFMCVALLVALAASTAFAALPGGRNGRELLQSGVSCPAQIPACTARRCTTRILDSKETYVCLRCLKGFVPVKGSDGKSIVQCVCPPGTVQTGSGNTKTCRPCAEGFYCPGGNRKAKNPNPPTGISGEEIACNPNNSTGLTTKSTRSSKPTDCVAEAGYVLPQSIGGVAQACTGNTYAPTNNRLKSCLPCQSGLAVPTWWPADQPRTNRNDVCQVPPGKFWELNVVRDCPKGLYREEFVRTDNKSAIACKNCPEGWTTENIGSGSVKLCNVLLPGYKLSDVTAGDTTPQLDPQDIDSFEPGTTEVCPIGFYFDGSAGLYGCVACPYGSTTRANGSTSADDCVVPPGYYLKETAANTGSMVMCPTSADENDSDNGYYRAGWKNYKEVIDTDGKTVCTKCGNGILSTPNDVDEKPGAADTDLVPASPNSCYVKAGWGISFDPQDFTAFRAVAPCPENTYGLANDTFGLINAPCKACTKNLRSPAGSTGMDACTNPGGFGYTSEGANQCPDGFWAEAGKMAPCEQCPEGRTTLYQPGNGTLQDSIEDCFVVPGHGIYDGDSDNPWNPSPNNSLPAKPCPVGLFSTGGSADGETNAKCMECPEDSTTINPGSTECTACKAGYGNETGTCQQCTYGTYNPGTSDTCSSCPSTTFNDPVGDAYTSYGITVRSGMINDDSCVPRYAQLPKPAGDRMGLPEDMFANVTLSAPTDFVGSVKQCVEACPADKCCIAEMATSEDESTLTCKHAVLSPIGSDATDKVVMFYKLPPSQFAAASTTDVKAKTIASGIYAICDINDYASPALGGLIGTSNNPTMIEAGRETIEWNVQCNSADSCKKACDADATCWGFLFHPTAEDNQPAFALRGGESWLGGRTFFVSPDATGGQDRSVAASAVRPALNLDALMW